MSEENKNMLPPGGAFNSVETLKNLGIAALFALFMYGVYDISLHIMQNEDERLDRIFKLFEKMILGRDAIIKDCMAIIEVHENKRTNAQ